MQLGSWRLSPISPHCKSGCLLDFQGSSTLSNSSLALGWFGKLQISSSASKFRSSLTPVVELRMEVSPKKMGQDTANTGVGIRPQWAAARPESTRPKLLTLVIIHKDEKVLLGMKKRGFGKGYYNGFGGKVEKGETTDEAAARELEEEAGVRALDMSERGILTFHFDNDPIPWEVHVYYVSEFEGEPCETEEMAPKWFNVSEIPYDSMWSDDPIWYPELLEGRHFKGDFYFENTTTLVSHSFEVTSIK